MSECDGINKEIAKDLLAAYLEENKPEEFKDPIKAAKLIAQMYKIILSEIQREDSAEDGGSNAAGQ